MMIMRSNLKEENKSAQRRVLHTIPYVLRLVESDNHQWSYSLADNRLLESFYDHSCFPLVRGHACVIAFCFAFLLFFNLYNAISVK